MSPKLLFLGAAAAVEVVEVVLSIWFKVIIMKTLKPEASRLLIASTSCAGGLTKGSLQPDSTWVGASRAGDDVFATLARVAFIDVGLVIIGWCNVLVLGSWTTTIFSNWQCEGETLKDIPRDSPIDKANASARVTLVAREVAVL